MKAKYFMTFILLLCISCAPASQSGEIVKVIYQDVFIPTPCEETLPPAPKAHDNVEIMLLNTIEYAEVLEAKLAICRGN